MSCRVESPWASSCIRLAIAAAAIAVGIASPAKAAFPGQNGRIAFESGPSATQEIFFMNGNGAGVRPFTALPAITMAGSPAWSADGLKVAFAGTVGGAAGIYAMRFDGTALVQITSGASDARPAWSPDGTKVAFERPDAGSGKTAVWVVAANGTGATEISGNPSSNDGQPAWSPDGTKIAFVSDRSGNPDVFVMAAGGGGATNLTNNPAADRDPNWSPDGASIAFTSDRSGTDAIWVVKSDGTGTPTMLTDGRQADSQPAWSPDGTRIAFTRAVTGGSEIFAMESSGALPARLGFDAAAERKPDWEPIHPDANPPVADAGPDQTIECTSPAGATAHLDGSGSSDADSSPHTNDDLVLFEWWDDFGTPAETFLGTGEKLSVVLSIASHDLTLQVSDKTGESARAQVTIAVVDTTPPVFRVIRLTPSLLWPPNHRLVAVHATVVAEDLCSPPVTIVLTSVTSSEPPLGHGSGHTNPDIQGATIGTADFDFLLRAERSGTGPGRVYTATYTATDARGNSASASATAIVPHDMGNGNGGGGQEGGPGAARGKARGPRGRGPGGSQLD